MWHRVPAIWSCFILLGHFRAKYTRSLNSEFLGPTLEKSWDFCILNFAMIFGVAQISKMSIFWGGLPAVQSFWRSQNRDHEPNPSPVELFWTILDYSSLSRHKLMKCKYFCSKWYTTKKCIQNKYFGHRIPSSSSTWTKLCAELMFIFFLLIFLTITIAPNLCFSIKLL